MRLSLTSPPLSLSSSHCLLPHLVLDHHHRLYTLLYNDRGAFFLEFGFRFVKIPNCCWTEDDDDVRMVSTNILMIIIMKPKSRFVANAQHLSFTFLLLSRACIFPVTLLSSISSAPTARSRQNLLFGLDQNASIEQYNRERPRKTRAGKAPEEKNKDLYTTSLS